MKALFTDHTYADLDLERTTLAAGGIELVDGGRLLTEDAVISAASGCCALLLERAPITARVLDALPAVGLVARVGAGYDTIDTAACAARGVWVSNCPDYGVGEVATHALAMALALVRHLPFYDRDVRRGTWRYGSTGVVRRCSDMTLGIVGFGRIGRRMAYLARNAFRRIVACDPKLIGGDFAAYVERRTLEAVFEEADVVSLHTPLTAETLGMIDRPLLERMRPGSFLVNTSRGAVVDIDDLAAVLATGHLDGVALDVLPVEPIPPDHPLARHERVLLTPHAAFYSRESERDLRQKCAQNVVSWRQTGRPDYVVVEGNRRPPR